MLPFLLTKAPRWVRVRFYFSAPSPEPCRTKALFCFHCLLPLPYRNLRCPLNSWLPFPLLQLIPWHDTLDAFPDAWSVTVCLRQTRTMSARKPSNLTVPSTGSARVSSTLSPRLSIHRSILGHSPPPSPGLPSLLPRHGKKPSTSSAIRRQLRLLLLFCGLVVLTWFGLRTLYSFRLSEGTTSFRKEGEYEIVEGSALPKEPSAVVVTDKRGRSHWTVHIPHHFRFPLRASYYGEICAQALETSHYLDGTFGTAGTSYYQKDSTFIDVGDAEKQGLLPQSDGPLLEGTGFKVCERSLTYVLETSDAGFGKSLLGLWMAYGLALKEKRAFFLDDTRWPYGKLSTFFDVPRPSELRPDGCLPPPPSHIVPCPHQARHIVVSAETIKYTFGAAFEDEYADRKQFGQRIHRAVFHMARKGYEAFSRLSDPDDAKYVEDRVKMLQEKVKVGGGMVIGIHVRRGDKHPWEYEYSKDYLPPDRYWDSAREILIDRFEGSSSSSSIMTSKAPMSKDPMMAEMSSVTILASDDPDMYSHSEMARALRAQDRIVLASKRTLEAASGGKKNKYIDEISGWEGGFFSSLFWSLGRKTRATDMPKYQPHAMAEHSNPSMKLGPAAQHETSRKPAAGQMDDSLSEEVLKLRELIGRAYLLDLAVLARSDAVTCAVSSTACRLVAVMMGWEQAIQRGWWRNVDHGGTGWFGIEY